MTNAHHQPQTEGMEKADRMAFERLKNLTWALAKLITVSLIIGMVGTAALSTNVIDISPIRVPKLLADSGFDSDVATRELKYALIDSRWRTIHRQLSTKIELENDVPSFDIPETGISFAAVVTLIRQVLPESLQRSRIDSYFMFFDNQLRLNVRYNNHLIFDRIVEVINQNVVPMALSFLIQRAAVSVNQELYRALIEVKPNSAPLHVGLGYLWKDEYRSEESFDEFLEALRLDPSNLDANVALGFYYKDRFEQDKIIKNENIKKAERYFDAATNINDAQPDAHIGLALIELNNNAIEESRSELNYLLTLNPNSNEAHVTLAMISMAESAPDYANAVREIKKAMQLTERPSNAYLVLGDIRRREHKLTRAADAYRQAIILSPHYYDAYVKLGSVLVEAKELDDALQQLQMAIWLSPERASMDICQTIADINSAANSNNNVPSTTHDLVDRMMLEFGGCPKQN